MDNAFTLLEQGAWGGLLGIYGSLMRRIEADLQEHSRISHVEFEVLLRLSWAEGHRLRIQDLAEQSVLTRSGVSRMVGRLEQAGLVTREHATEDRRGAYAVLTEAGLDHFHRALQAHIVFVRRNFLEFFNNEELAQMAEFWQRVEQDTAKTQDQTA
ncbi:MAG: MarR family transcriptional regulator [Chloroflexi bacterium]|nr:MarR family transcriptional regulator [Chloroflexota bacterium]